MAEIKIIEKLNISVPTLNIESFGVDGRPAGFNGSNWDCLQYYIASFDFILKSLFGKHVKTVYIPILFKDDATIADIMTHYNDLYFSFTFKYGYSGSHRTDIFHISHLSKIENIFNKEWDDLFIHNNEPHGFKINLYIKNYKGYDIDVSDSWDNQYVWERSDINTFYTIDGAKNCLTDIKKEYSALPKYLYCFTQLKHNMLLYHETKLSDLLKYIDNILLEEEEYNKKIDSLYSKKSFKLVEN